MAKIGFLGASIGLTDTGPGESNHYIASMLLQNVERKSDSVVACQWEITDALRERGFKNFVDLDIPVDKRGKYLSGDDLVQVAAPFFHERDVTEVVIVTDWILWIKLYLLFRKEGFKVRLRGFDWVPFDKDSIQPWTRNHFILFYYALRQVLFGHQGRYIEPTGYSVRTESLTHRKEWFTLIQTKS